MNQFRCECRTVLNCHILITRHVKGREPRHVGAGGVPTYGGREELPSTVEREGRMRIGKAMVYANHAVILTGRTFVSLVEGLRQNVNLR